MGKTRFRFFILVSAMLLVCMPASAVQKHEGKQHEGKHKFDCNDGWNSDRPSYCEIKEQRIAHTGSLSVDGRKNGGVSVKGWENSDVLVRARIQGSGKTDAEARETVSQIRIDASGGKVRAEGPTGEDRRWSVSYEIFVPRNSDLSLQTVNGGIAISDVNGRISFEAVNGGVSLKRLSGAVAGQTTNGGLAIDLDGDRWNGEGMNVKTTNGGISLSVPENYSARLETGTTNGGMRVGFPIMVQGRINKEISVDLGSGGATVRAITTNGGVSINRKGIDH